MKRIEAVYAKLKELDDGKGVTTDLIAERLNLGRANVSTDLNRLCEEGKVLKEGTRPVLYRVALNSPASKTLPETNTLDKLAIKNPSLYSSIEQAKAAILYPPRGMHILILGETGVGKSMFAGLVHRYAIEMKRMEEASPFVVFNCADYSNNPQLLLGQLFGTMKGAYTGADRDKAGLIEKADGGILFLDEVHRLPPEGQEMFFTFMDRFTFRRLGETDNERTARVLIISATTENPESSLLKTFTRRIPMIIKIPSLKERSFEERLILVSQFMREESSRLGKPISVSVNAMRALTSYPCPNNIGQLKTDIQLSCAKAYVDFVSNKKDEIRVHSGELPSYIKEGLYAETEHRQLWNKLIGINKRYCIFTEGEDRILFEEEPENSIYELIDMRVHELTGKGLRGEELDREMEKDIQEYFSNYLQDVNKGANLANLEALVGKEIVRVTEEIVKYSEERLHKAFSKKVFYALAVHLFNARDRLIRNRRIENPRLNKIRTEHREAFYTAADCLKIMSRILDIEFPLDEAGFLAMFFIINDNVFTEKKYQVQVVVIAHGAATATSMADTANRLLGANAVVGFNAPMDEKPGAVMSLVKDYILKSGENLDYIFLVDMGSFTNIGDEIRKDMAVNTKTITLVSTLHVIEAARKAMMGYPLDYVYEETLRVNELSDHNPRPERRDGGAREKLALITLCTTGEGSAAGMIELLERLLGPANPSVTFIPLNIVGRETVYSRLKHLEKQYKIIGVISPFYLDTEYRQFGVDEIINRQALPEIQRLIDTETTFINLGDTLSGQLKNIGGTEVLQRVKALVERLQEELGIRIDTSILIGITMHLCCMIDRLAGGGAVKEFPDRQSYTAANSQLYHLVKKECEELNGFYGIQISEDEIAYIMAFFNPEHHTGAKHS